MGATAMAAVGSCRATTPLSGPPASVVGEGTAASLAGAGASGVAPVLPSLGGDAASAGWPPPSTEGGSEGGVVSSQPYMSPEQATGRPVDARSDVFSLGLIFYELAAGRHPFPGDSALEVAAAIVRDKPAPASSFNPEIKPALERILTTCLAKAPRDRYSTARDLLRDLLGHDVSTDPSPAFVARPSSRRKGYIVAGLAMGLVALASLGLWSRRASENPPPPGRQPAASVPRPAPRSASPEAVRLYFEALQADRDGRSRAAEDAYKRAVELDPALAPALLRLGLQDGPTDGSREYFRRAVAHREALDERDKGWLHAWEPVMQREPADQVETIRRLRALVRRFPDDTQIATDLANWICSSPDIAPESRVAEAEASGLGPASLARVTNCNHVNLGRLDEMLDAHSRCIDREPSNVRCLGGRSNTLTYLGRCAEAEAVARRVLTLEPEGWGVGQLANALLGQGGHEEAVRELLRKGRASLPERDRALATARDEMTLAIVGGDFATAIARLQSLRDLVKDAREEREHAAPALLLAAIFEEIGRPEDARRVARSFLARRAAYEPDPTRTELATLEDPTGILLGIERRAGGLSPEQHRQQLQARLDWWDRRLGKSWLRYFVWRMQYATAVQTPAEAREALAARPRFGRTYEHDDDDHDFAAVGRTYLLGGMVDEALPELESAAKNCAWLYGHPIEHMRAWFFLGEARAAKGDKEGACRAHDSLIERWGRAKPRSVTADRARARRIALGCR